MKPAGSLEPILIIVSVNKQINGCTRFEKSLIFHWEVQILFMKDNPDMLPFLKFIYTIIYYRL